VRKREWDASRVFVRYCMISTEFLLPYLISMLVLAIKPALRGP